MSTSNVDSALALAPAAQPAARAIERMLERAVAGAQSGLTETAHAPRRPQAPADAGQVRRELEATLERIAAKDTRLSFEVDDTSGRTVIYVRDGRTAEVLKQIPSEEMLEVARRLEAHLSDLAHGSGVLLADEA